MVAQLKEEGGGTHAQAGRQADAWPASLRAKATDARDHLVLSLRNHLPVCKLRCSIVSEFDSSASAV